MTELSHILNWRRMNDLITLSGQPTETQLGEIKATGVTHIINLGPHHNKGALKDEAGSVNALGMEYIYIPVEFETPQESDFTQFCAALDELEDAKVHIHCIYNARVTAFVYKLSLQGRGISREAAFAMMDSIWRPGADWAEFIETPSAAGKKNRYAGYEYQT